jgi:hypothetical protein
LQTITILYLLIAILLSLAISYFQYFYKAKKNPKIHFLLFSLKALSLFLLLLLFINPKIKTTELENIKPTLSILVDDSKSISFFKEERNVQEFISKLNKNSNLSAKFTIENLMFSSDLKVSDSLSFSGNETNIYKALAAVNKLNTNKNAPILLLSDGNQTIGTDYEYLNSKQIIYPIVFGDTTKYKDLTVSQVNVNKYSYLKNKFPVEVILNYEGNEAVKSIFSIFRDGKAIFSKNMKFSKEESSQIITTNLTATKEGVNYYTAAIQKIKDEKNIKNNAKNFSVEVIDEQTKVLLLTSVLHPDIGAFKKAIESNKQRSVDVFMIDKFDKQISNYQLIMLYQPNNLFKNIFTEIKRTNSNFLLLTGANADWNFINKQQLGFTKNQIDQTENYGAIYNPSFLTFIQKDIGFDQFSPLTDKFGEVTFSTEHQNLILQNINGLETQQPLIAVYERNNQKKGVIFGEGIWKWRASSYLNTNSFQDFDQFIGNLVQYVSSKKKRNRLEIQAENQYSVNTVIHISAFYTDKNYQFDARASLEIMITNKKTKEITKLPFSLINNSYQIAIENLSSGTYRFKVNVLGQDIAKYGSFKISEYQVEQQFTHTNIDKLTKLALKSGGKLFYKEESENLIQNLLQSTVYFTVQKSSVKARNLIDWRWILFLIISLLSAEWFIRKYFGAI